MKKVFLTSFVTCKFTFKKINIALAPCDIARNIILVIQQFV